MKRVVRSTLSAEGYAISEAGEYGEWFRQILTELRLAQSTGVHPKLKMVEKESGKIPLLVLTDSQNLQATVAKDSGVVKDKRLRIVASMLRELFGENSTKLQWIPTNMMAADALTKAMCVAVLVAFMKATRATFPPAKRTALQALALSLAAGKSRAGS